MFAIFVTLRIKNKFVEQYREASYGDSEGSVRDEPGCFRFDILQNSESANTFHLYEVYQDKAAFEKHQKTHILRSGLRPLNRGLLLQRPQLL